MMLMQRTAKKSRHDRNYIFGHSTTAQYSAFVEESEFDSNAQSPVGQRRRPRSDMKTGTTKTPKVKAATLEERQTAIEKVLSGNEYDYPRILGVTPDADQKDIFKAYRSIAMLVHPDRNLEQPSQAGRAYQCEAPHCADACVEC